MKLESGAEKGLNPSHYNTALGCPHGVLTPDQVSVLFFLLILALSPFHFTDYRVPSEVTFNISYLH